MPGMWIEVYLAKKNKRSLRQNDSKVLIVYSECSLSKVEGFYLSLTGWDGVASEAVNTYQKNKRREVMKTSEWESRSFLDVWFEKINIHQGDLNARSPRVSTKFGARTFSFLFQCLKNQAHV